MKTIINKTSIFFQSIITVCIFSAFGIAQNTISIEVGDGTIDVLYNSDADIGGFQFTVEGATVTGTSGGDAAANGFTVTCNSTLCLGFSFSGAIIPPGSGTLVVVSADITGDVSLTGIVVSDAAGNALDFSYDSGPEAADYVVEVSNNVFTPDHLDISAGETVEWINMGGFHNVDGSTDTYPNNPDSFYNGTASSDLWSYSFTFTIAGNYDYECNPHAPSMAGTITVGSGGCTDDMACNYDAGAEFDDGSCLNNDCAGVCGGSAEVDECGVCGGDGSDDLGCGCFVAGPSGCDNVCGSTLENDACGVCGGDGSDDLGCGCFEAGPSGCDNVCGSTLENDECGVCGGDGIADGACDCAGNVDDCAGICGGSTEVDECGICGGPGATGECGCDGIAEGTCDCDGNVLDECGVCGGDGIAEGFCDCTGNVDLGCGCSAAGPSGCDNACGSTLENDECGVCGGDGIAEGSCDCAGNVDLGCGCGAAGPSGCDNACGSTLENDACGICGGDGSDDLGCGCFAAGPSGCDNVCGSTLENDECGVCGGDGSSCASSIIDILYNTTSDIGGFQFNVDGVTILSVSGGAAADAGFSSSYGNNTVLGFSFTGATIPAGSGVLVQVEVDGDTDAACLSAVVLSDAVGGAIVNEVTDCFTISQVEIILGCLDMAACNYNVDATEDDGSCTYAEENYDCDGNCTVEVDCFSVCGGGAVEDECGECGGDGIVGHACDCDGNVDDCAGECGGSAVEDDCGVCGGDGTSCIPVQLGFGAVSDGNMEITYNSPADIAGFQFNLTGVNITSASGGAAGENGFMISSSSTTVIAFSLTGATIPSGSGVLIELTYEATAEQACLDSPVISDTNGEGLDIEIGSCTDLDYTCDDVDADGICDDVDDCVGEYDDCGVCNGGNADMDCAGDCNGSAVEDDCGVCEGGNADMDCAGVCGGSAVVDECGECGGDGIDEGACDCAGSVEDCAGVCGGDAVVDECGECVGIDITVSPIHSSVVIGYNSCYAILYI